MYVLNNNNLETHLEKIQLLFQIQNANVMQLQNPLMKFIHYTFIDGKRFMNR